VPPAINQLVAIPDRPNRIQHRPPFIIRFGGEEMNNTGAQIESVSNDVHREHEAKRDEPEGFHL
jgi:hypothetical protein